MSRLNGAVDFDLKQMIASTIKAMVRTNLPMTVRHSRRYGMWYVKQFDGADNLKLHIVMCNGETDERRVFELSIKEKKQ